MSMPRAAMSVATSTLVCPALKPSSAATRAVWLLLPWMAAAGMPCLFRSLAILSAPCLVRVKTSAFCTGGFRFWMSHGSRNFLLPFSTKYRLWSMRSTVLDTGSTLTKAGSCRMPAASCSISLGMVAREHQVLAHFGQLCDDLLHVMHKAHVQHPVGLVQHEDLDAAEVDEPLPAQGRSGGRGRR